MCDIRNYNRFTDVRVLEITSVHSKSPLSAVSSLVIAKQQLPTVAAPLAACVLTVDP